jgi:hypothetical protein
MADPRYIADHLVRIQTEHRDSSYAKLDEGKQALVEQKVARQFGYRS